MSDNLILSDKQWFKIREFIITIRVVARNDVYFGRASNDARGRMIHDIENALVDKSRENRLNVLRAITGLNIDSSIRLTAHYVSTIIEETIDGKNDETLQNIERYIESKPDCESWNLFTWESNTSSMSNLQPSDY